MKTLAWGSVPNNVRAWCACNMMANKAAMDNDALTIINLTIATNDLKTSVEPSSMINGRVIRAFESVTFLKPLWLVAVEGCLPSAADRFNATLVFYAQGITDKQVEHLCGHLSRAFGCLSNAHRYRGLELEGKDFRVMFGGLEDGRSKVHSSRATINLTLHQIHVEVAKENAAGVQEQVEMPFELTEEAHAELARMEEMPAEVLAEAPVLSRPSIKDNWIVGWRLVGTAIKQYAIETFARLTLGKSYTH